MYPVSDQYKAAIAKNTRDFNIRAKICFADNTVQTYSDNTIENDVVIESQMMAGSPRDDSIDIGAATAKKLTMTVKNEKTDLHRFAGARLWLYVSLKLDNGAFEDVPMGKFFINNKSITRINDRVTFSAYDGMILLHYELTDEMRAQLKGKTALEAARILCGGHLDFAEPKDPEGNAVTLPNCDLELDFDSQQIETARDGIMWIAQLMGCFARVNRLGQLEFVQIKSWWKMYTENTGTILAVRNIQGDQRFKTRFADDRIHIVGVAMRNSANQLITHRYSYTHNSDDDPTSDVIVEMAANPLITTSKTPLSTILENILVELSTAYFYSFTTEMANDPALDAGDTIRLQGGIINGTNHNNDLIGFITHNVWRYRGRQEITNASSVPIVFDGDDVTSSENIASAEYADGDTTSENSTDVAEISPMFRARAVSAVSESVDDLNYLPPKAQSEKALARKVITSELVGNFGGQYIFKWDSPIGFKAFDPQKKQLLSLNMIGNTISLNWGNNSSQVYIGDDHMEIYFGGSRRISLESNGRTQIFGSNGSASNITIEPNRYINIGGWFTADKNAGTLYLNNQLVFKAT